MLGKGVLYEAGESDEERPGAGTGDSIVAVTPRSGQAITFQDRMTYACLEAEVARMAGWLTAVGIGRGERVALYARNHPESFVTLLAVSRIGALMVPLNWRLSEALIVQKFRASADPPWPRIRRYGDCRRGICQEIGDSLDAARAGHVMADEASGDDIWSSTPLDP